MDPEGHLVIKRMVTDMIDLDNDTIYRNIMEQMRDIILVVDTNGNILITNTAAVHAYGYSRDELCGMQIYELRSPETRAAVDAQLKIAQQAGILFRTVHMRRTGETFPVEVSSQRVRLLNKEAVISVVRDITATVTMETAIRQSEGNYRYLHEELTTAYEELAASEEELRQQLDELLAREQAIHRRNIVLASLHETALKLMQKTNLHDILRLIAASAAKLLGTTHSYINLVDEEKGIFCSEIGLGHYAQLVGRDIKLTEGISGQVYKTGEIVVLDDYSTWEHRLPDPLFDLVHSVAYVPMKAGDQVIGTFSVGFLNPEQSFSDEDIAFLGRFADLAAIAVQNSQLVSALKRSEQELREKNAELTAAHKELLASEAKYRAIFEAASDGIFIHDTETGEILDINEKACVMHGYTREDVLAGGFGIFDTGEPQFNGEEARRRMEHTVAGKSQLFAWKNKHKAGHPIWMEVNLQRAVIDQKERILAIVRDISERKAQEQVIQRLAYHDALTGLPNRAYLREFLNLEMEKAQQEETSGAVLFIDLDNLKTINDTFGHSYGDEVIIKTGSYICAAMQERAFVARIGGDEFIVVLPGEANRGKIRNIAAGMVKLLERDYELGTSRAYMSASIGIACYPDDGDTTEAILKKADLALYAAKGNGKNTWHFYETDLQKTADEDMLIKQGLREAIKRNELYLHYQPLGNPHTLAVVGFEALLRWNSAELGPVSPGRFIPLAEENGTIQTIGEWVIGEACRFARRLADRGKSHLRVAVNVSPRQLAAENFVPLVREAIRTAGINAGQLEIEITENALIVSMEDSIQKLKALRTLGIRLSLDDFGSGYCSLTYLKNLPVETLKIDKLFIDDIESDADQLRFVNSIVSMAQLQGLSVVAEGVETESQLNKVRQCQCNFIQGYIFCRPLPETDAMLFLNNTGAN